MVKTGAAVTHSITSRPGYRPAVCRGFIQSPMKTAGTAACPEIGQNRLLPIHQSLPHISQPFPRRIRIDTTSALDTKARQTPAKGRHNGEHSSESTATCAMDKLSIAHANLCKVDSSSPLLPEHPVTRN